MQKDHPPSTPPPVGLFRPTFPARELETLRQFAVEERRLVSLAEDYAPEKVRLQINAARELHEKSPTEETFFDLQFLLERDPNKPTAYQQLRVLRRAAYALAWAFFIDTVCPQLSRMVDCAIAEMEAMKATHAELSADLAAADELYQAWAQYLGEKPSVRPDLCALLDARALALRQALASLPGTPQPGGPPWVEVAALAVLQIDITPERGIVAAASHGNS